MKKAFTLIEMMIAVTLFSFIAVFLSSTLQSLQLNSSILKTEASKQNKEMKILKLLEDDIQQSLSLNIVPSDDYILLNMQTRSSIYNISAAYVRWFVDPKTSQLIRSESSLSTLPPYDKLQLSLIHLDALNKEVKWFKAYQSKDKSSLFLSLKIKEKNIYLELLTPQHKSKK